MRAWSSAHVSVIIIWDLGISPVEPARPQQRLPIALLSALKPSDPQQDERDERTAPKQATGDRACRRALVDGRAIVSIVRGGGDIGREGWYIRG